MVVVDEVGRRAMEATDKSKISNRRHSHNADSSSGPSGSRGRRQKPTRKARRGMLVMWQERPLGERVLEKAHRFGEIRIEQSRTRFRVILLTRYEK